MTQLQAEKIAAEHYADYGPVTFRPHQRGWIVSGWDCYDRLVEIVVG